MAKVSLLGQAYAVRSPAVAVQDSINLYLERIEDPTERQKNDYAQYGDPGYQVFKDMTAIDSRFAHLRGIACFGSTNGSTRCFVAGGNGSGASDGCYCEIDSSGSLVGSVRTISNAPVNGMSNSPVQFFANGNQLMIVGGGLAYIDNGSGPTVITFDAFGGLVNTTSGGYQVDWVSGDKFDPSMVGGSIVINGGTFTVWNFFDAQTITVTTPVPSSPLTGVAYSYTPGPTLGAVTGGYLDGYYLISRPNSRQYNFGSVNNSTGAIWNGLDFGTKNSQPDYLQSLLAQDDLYLFGTDSFDVHRNTGGSATSTSPFQKMDGASSVIGSCSPWGPIYINGLVYFLGGNSQGRVVAYVLDGYTPVRISTHAEEYQWALASLGTNCVSYSEEHQGHFFWVINFGSQTWVYDLTSQAWTQRKWYNGSAFTTFPIQYHSYATSFSGGLHLVCGGASGTIYKASLDYYEFAGSDFKWQRTGPHFYNGGKQQYFGRMTMEIETGGQASGTPVVTREWSDDRGQTFGHAETASLGSFGQFSMRVFWPSTSCSRDRVFRFSGVGKYKVAIVALDCELTYGSY